MVGAGLFAFPGLGLVEPIAACAGAGSLGDDLDAADVDGPAVFPVYFSPDGPIASVCTLLDSATLNSGGTLSAADVLATSAPGPSAST